MADTVKLTLSAHHKGDLPGDTIEVSPIEARRLVNAGVAVPTTKTAAKAVGVDPDSIGS
jgi:hypothetical protein